MLVLITAMYWYDLLILKPKVRKTDWASFYRAEVLSIDIIKTLKKFGNTLLRNKFLKNIGNFNILKMSIDRTLYCYLKVLLPLYNNFLSEGTETNI